MATIEKRKGKKGTTYRATVRRSGYPRQIKTFPSRQDAQDWADELERDIRDRRLAPHRLAQRKTLSDAVDKYLPTIAETKNYKDTHRICLWWKSKLGTATLSDLTAIAIHETLDTLSCSGATKNRYLGALSGCLSCVSKAPYGWTQGNPCRDVPRRKEGKARQRVLTRKEWEKLRQHVDKIATSGSLRESQLPLFIRLAYETGRRRGELLKLRWEDVDLDDGLLYLLDTKTGDDQVAPISDEMVRRIKNHPRREGWTYIFQGRSPNKTTDFDEVLRAILRELFPPDRKGEVPVLHSLRHTAATEMGDGGATEAQIMAVTGHKSSASVHRYVKKTTEAARAAQKLRGGEKT
jgi:integrase